jgi:uncharacterized protein YecE (DUF72 family)
MTRSPTARIGTSGWQYDHWRGLFYPEDLPKRAWFDHYAERFDTVEINNTFYRLPEAAAFKAWHDQAPSGFLYAVKYSRFGSHMKKLKEPASHIGLFIQRAAPLGALLGPILVQLPPGWHVDVPRLADFLAAAPAKLRWAVEFRDPSWLCDDVFTCLADAGSALCVHDLLEDHPRVPTADWVYLRFHGGVSSGYGGSYSPQALSAEARRIRADLEAGRDVYAYFNNDIGGHALGNAEQLRRYLQS